MSYGDTHEERYRELMETGSSVRRTGRPIMTILAEALGLDTKQEAAEKHTAGEDDEPTTASHA